MKGLKKIISITVTAALLAAALPFSALARSAITSVSIRVDNNIEPGDRLPDITVEDRSGGGGGSADSGDIVVSTSNSKYYIRDAEWVTSSNRDLDVGEQPKMKVYIRPTDSDDHYFKGSYSSSNISIKNGSYVSAKKSGEDLVVTLKISAIEGTYDPPEDAYWRDSGYGKARWKAGDVSSNTFDVYLYRGGSVVTKLESIKATSYDFYPYMTKEGTYSFKVRAVPGSESDKKYAKKSEWTESDDMYINKEHVSDGRGQGVTNAGTSQVGWIQQSGTWYYKYPDGSYQKNSWLKVNDKWYLFDSSGRMLTGWQNRNNQTYFLNSNGDMFTGWFKDGNKWYYLNQNQGDFEGAMVKNSWVTQNGKTYYMNNEGVMVEGWYQIAGQWYYFYPGDGSKAVNTTIDTFYVDANGVWVR